jgi:hypothetical protein
VHDEAVGPGAVLAGRYRIEDLLAESAGAKSWRATDKILARSVAVDVLPSSDERSAALLQAARRSASVPDGRFLRVLDATEEDRNVFVVREWANGESLDAVLSDGPMAHRRAAWIVAEIADAVGRAHRSDIYHLRLIPENIVITDNGGVKIIGLATDAAIRGNSIPSPTQSDVRDLGQLLYACLVARWPDGPDHGLPAAPTEHGRLLRPRQVRAGVPRALDEVCDRILGTPPRHGLKPLRSADQVAAALTSIVDEMPDPTVGAALGAAPGLLPARDRTGDGTAAMPRSAPLGTGNGGRSTLAGTGTGGPSMPVAHPGAAAPPGARPNATDPGGWGRTLLWVALAALVLGAALLAFQLGKYNFGDNNADPVRPGAAGSTTSGGTSDPQPVRIAAVSDFDPTTDSDSDGEENPDKVPLATDGDPSTAWTTVTYYNNPELGGLKPGVGLLLDLGKATTVADVKVTLIGQPTSVELRAAPEDVTSAPTSADQLDIVASAPNAGLQADLQPDEPVTTRYLLVYLTKLPPAPGGFEGQIAEVSVSG